jgi:hypothetical protein
MEKKLNGFNNGRDKTDGVGGGPTPDEMDAEFMFFERVENAIKVLKTMLRTANLKLGQEAAESLLEEIKKKRIKSEE